jgi:hypothetical protein
VLLAAGCAHPGAGPGKLVRISPEKKLIEWGWDEPNPAYLRANAARLDTFGFDGVIFHAEPLQEGKRVNFAWECWGARRFALVDRGASASGLSRCPSAGAPAARAG